MMIVMGSMIVNMMLIMILISMDSMMGSMMVYLMDIMIFIMMISMMAAMLFILLIAAMLRGLAQVGNDMLRLCVVEAFILLVIGQLLL